MRVSEAEGVRQLPGTPKIERIPQQDKGFQQQEIKNEHVHDKQTGQEDKDREPAALEKQIIQAIERANESLVGPRTMFKFSIHEGTKEIMVKVLDEETEEIIREIPPEKILDMVAKIWEMAGIIVDERV